MNRLNKLNRITLLGSVLIIAALALAACAPASSPQIPATLVPPANSLPLANPSATPNTSNKQAALPDASNVTLKVATNASLGSFLVDGNGMTLYLFTKDAPNTSNCSGGCLAKWPPLLVKGAPAAGEGVKVSLIGTITRADGTQQATYNQMPLYYWYTDKVPGDTLGQNVGKVWFVVDPSGKAVGLAPAAMPAAPIYPPAPTKSGY
jgi:predicted lipoprotein with Yx(FWY)xxD motif